MPKDRLGMTALEYKKTGRRNAMLYNYLEIIPFVLLLPVGLYIVLPLGMLVVYLMMKLILRGLKQVSGEAVAKSELSVATGSKSLGKESAP